MQYTLNVNGETRTVDAEPDTPLLWVLRDTLRLTGTKFGCGIAQCGACTVMLDGQPTRSCQATIDTIENGKITTIEGLNGKAAEAVQKAWIAIDVPQCGYCQSGQIMSATALLTETPKPTDQDINNAMSGNVCRCATYVRIRQAIRDASKAMEG